MAYVRFFGMAVLGILSPAIPLITTAASLIRHLADYGEHFADALAETHKNITSR